MFHNVSSISSNPQTILFTFSDLSSFHLTYPSRKLTWNLKIAPMRKKHMQFTIQSICDSILTSYIFYRYIPYTRPPSYIKQPRTNWPSQVPWPVKQWSSFFEWPVAALVQRNSTNRFQQKQQGNIDTYFSSWWSVKLDHFPNWGWQ